jgi:hypothetical protein
MQRCMVCGKEKEERELSGRICRPCADSVRRESAGQKLHEKQAADRATRASGQAPAEPKSPKR